MVSGEDDISGEQGESDISGNPLLKDYGSEEGELEGDEEGEDNFQEAGSDSSDE